MSALSLPDSHLDELDHLAATYWWHVHRIETVLQLADAFVERKKPVCYLDVGCGTGATTQLIAQGLARQGRLDQVMAGSVTGLDTDPRLRSFCENNGLRLEFTDLQKGEVPSGDSRFGLFTILDVLEHIERPEPLLIKLHERLAPGAIGVITAPSSDIPFSKWDVSAGHFRRYSKKDLEGLFDRCRYRVLWCSSLYSFAWMPAWLMRKFELGRSEKIKRLEFPRVPGWFNRILLVLASSERWILKRRPVPCGTSVIVVVQAGA